MDSVSQFALGAGIGLVVLGPRMGARKAALTGGLLGSLPDADVFLSYADPVASFVGHRGFSHSLVVHALLTPILGEGLRRITGSLRLDRRRAWLAVFLCLTTHALLDAMTIYGTRLFWPIWPEPLGLGSMFIIDPTYTLPLLLATLWALVLGGWGPRLRRATIAALMVSTAYLGWSAMGQQIAAARAERYLAAVGVVPAAITATPAPFSTLLWKIIAIDGDRYFNIYVPLLGGEDAITAYAHPRHPEVAACLGANSTVATLSAFTDGFYRFTEQNGAIVMADLRMGLTPLYAFRFVLAEHGSEGLRPVPPQPVNGGREADGDRAWLKAGILGLKATRPAESTALIDPSALQTQEAAPSGAIGC